MLLNETDYRKEYFPGKESDTKLLESIYFAYEVGIIKLLFKYNMLQKDC